MKIDNLIYKLLTKLERTYIEKKKRYKFFFIYYYIQELIVKNYFDKLIFENLLTEDNIVGFLEANEFGVKNSKFNKYLYKKDIIDENSFYGELNNVEVVKTIKTDFEEALMEEISKSNITIDIENYINVFVNVEKDDFKKIRIYSIYIRYYRNYIIDEHKTSFKKLLKYILIIFGLLILGYFTYQLVPTIHTLIK